MNHLLRSRVFPLLGCLAFAGCSTIATFDQAAYAKATAARVDSLVIMGKATDSFV